MFLFYILITFLQFFIINSIMNDNQIMKYKSIIKSFQPSVFQPLSYFEKNCHWQTIFGSTAFQSKIFGAPNRTFDVYSERFETFDSDFFDVEYTKDFIQSNKVVLLLHGLESNTKGPLITAFTKSFLLKGFECCLISFRGCNGEENRQPGAYHLGFTSDLKQLVTILHQRFPDKRMYLCGFSLGGNVILKCLGELSEKAMDFGIYGAAVTCVPFDPIACQRKLDVEKQHIKFPNSFDIEEIRKVDTIGGFDDAYIAKIYGFQDKFDYYRQSGSKWWLPHIRVPAIAINARDDPFIEESSLPNEEEDVGTIAPVRLIYHTYGGHCGFSTSQPYMTGNHELTQVDTNDNNNIDKEISGMKIDGNARNKVPSHGWLAEELTRAIDHIHNNIDI